MEVEREPTLGDLLGAALGWKPEDDERALQVALVESVACQIAAHYGLHPDDAVEEVWEQEAHYFDANGLHNLGPVLEHPDGIALLGLAVAQRLLGADEADAMPRFTPTIH